jgi:hypothetical protein
MHSSPRQETKLRFYLYALAFFYFSFFPFLFFTLCFSLSHFFSSVPIHFQASFVPLSLIVYIIFFHFISPSFVFFFYFLLTQSVLMFYFLRISDDISGNSKLEIIRYFLPILQRPLFVLINALRHFLQPSIQYIV